MVPVNKKSQRYYPHSVWVHKVHQVTKVITNTIKNCYSTWVSMVTFTAHIFWFYIHILISLPYLKTLLDVISQNKFQYCIHRALRSYKLRLSQQDLWFQKHEKDTQAKSGSMVKFNISTRFAKNCLTKFACLRRHIVMMQKIYSYGRRFALFSWNSQNMLP